MVEFHVVLFLLSFALVWKIVYIALIIDDGENYRNIINIIGDICILCVGMRFVWVSYHKSISDKLDQTIDSIAEREKENKTLIAAIEAQEEKLSLAIDKENKDRIAAIEAQGEKLSLAIVAQGETLSKVINKNTMQHKIQRDLYANDIEGVFNEMGSLKNSVYRLEEMVRTELRTIFQLK